MIQQPKKSICKGCGAEILWIRTVAGQFAPIDLKEKSFFVLVGDDSAALRKGHEPHFVTCPNADRFKKKKESK